MDPPPPPAIEFRGVGMDFPGADGSTVTAVEGVELVVEEGETVCLIGTSGSGKTTLLRMVNRLVQPTRGDVIVRGVSVKVHDAVRLRRDTGYVIQSGGLFPHMTVGRNIGLLCELEGWDEEAQRTRVNDLLELVHLPPDEFAARMPAELSGGERQRVGVARALALDPPLLLMDEPFGALDPITRNTLRDDFAELRAAVRKTVLLVTHDMAEAFTLGDRVALMNAGRLIQAGSVADFRHRPADAFVTAFLAEHFA